MCMHMYVATCTCCNKQQHQPDTHTRRNSNSTSLTTQGTLRSEEEISPPLGPPTLDPDFLVPPPVLSAGQAARPAWMPGSSYFSAQTRAAAWGTSRLWPCSA